MTLPPIWSAVVHWFLSVPPNGEAKDALIAIASVAAVVWTGGLITMQLKKLSTILGNALDYVQTAFMGACFGLFATGVPLRCAVIVFGLIYTIQSIASLVQSTWLLRRAKAGEVVFKHKNGIWYYTERFAKGTRQYAWTTLASMLAYVAVFVWPTQYAMCWFGWGLLYLGMQMILWQLYKIEKPLEVPAPVLPTLLPSGAINPIPSQDR